MSSANDKRDGQKFTILTTTGPGGAGIVAVMTCKGRKTTWDAYGADKVEAVANVLRYIRADLHPFVAIDPAPVAPKAQAPRASLVWVDGRLGRAVVDGNGILRHE